MLFIALTVLLGLMGLFRSLRSVFYLVHVMIVAGISWWMGSQHAGWNQLHPSSAYAVGILHLVFINILIFMAYGLGKRAAIKGSARIPERTLHAMALIGGTPMALVASRIFRHKTKKGSFRVRFWLIAIVQIAVIVYASQRLYGW